MSFSLSQSAECLKKCVEDVKTKNDNVGLAVMFPQLWDTPALGFLGVAAARDTVAFTTIFTSLDPESKTSYVYFDGRFAYVVHNPNEKFLAEVSAHQVGSVLFQSDYETSLEEPTTDGQVDQLE